MSFEVPYLIPYSAEFDDELQYLNSIVTCWDGRDPNVDDTAHFLVYNGSEIVIWMPDAAPADGADGIDVIWTGAWSILTVEDSELFRDATELDPTVDPVVLPGEFARVHRAYEWYVNYPMSVARLAQTKITSMIQDLKPKAYKRIFVGKSLQRKALVDCVGAALQVGADGARSDEHLTARELFSSSVGIARSATRCADSWRAVNGKAKVKNRLPSLKKGVVPLGTVAKYSEPTGDFPRLLARAVATVK